MFGLLRVKAQDSHLDFNPAASTRRGGRLYDYHSNQSRRRANLTCAVHSSDPVRQGGHLITSSARRSSDGGIVSPSAFAVFRLMTNLNSVGCSIGSSPGLAPLRILSTYVAARRHAS